jgi:plastocyanin
VKRARYVAGVLGAVGVAVALPISANAATRTVTMGTAGKNAKKLQKLGSDVNDFFPHTTTIHVGDKVKFSPTGFHTVNFPARGKDPDALVAPTGQLIAGANDAAGLPFWFNGQPNLQFNPVLLAGKYGKKVTLNRKKGLQSGLPLAPKNKPMTVKFTKAGKYTYYCTVHAGMTGKLTVLKHRKRIPSAKAHAKKVKAQYKRDLKIAKRLPGTNVPAGTVDVGVAGKHGVEFYGMLPAKVTIPSGTSLQFRMSKGSFEDHTATTGPGNPETEPSSYLGQIAASFAGAQLDQRGVYPSEAPSTTATLTPSLHGNGFWNSGVMDTAAGNPLPGANTVKFGEPTGVYHVPGTYTFYCMIHPFMKVDVVVQ